jgi:oligopeptide/dipeptide ABC transporter ATP-binding protein
MSKEPVLQIDNLAVSFPGGANGRRVQAADHVSMSIFPAQTLAVVGESGSGKSVSALSVLQLIPHPPGRTDHGEIWWTADPTRPPTNLLTYTDKQMRAVRGNEIAMIFQEPMTSLNPVYTIGEQVLEAILLHQNVGRDQAIQIATGALRDVGIADPSSRLKEYPHQLSGGMRQRVMIAMALACQPALLLADEPTTALDVTIQAQILELLRKLQHEKQMAIMLITHDLGVVAENADVVAVMYSGRIVEYANVYDIFNNPMHPYTKGLLKSMPVLGRHVDRLPTVMDGAIVENFPAGYTCAPHVDKQNPEGGYGGPDARLYEIADKHWVLCTKDGASPNDELPAPRLDYRRDDVPSAV